LVQIHTHPQAAFLSEGDANHALNKRAGALNMIVPDFGTADWTHFRGFAMVERDSKGHWVPWTDADWSRLAVLPAEANFHGG
jgi:hypothetical protein